MAECVCMCMSVICLRGRSVFCVAFPTWAFYYLFHIYFCNSKELLKIAVFEHFEKIIWYVLAINLKCFSFCTKRQFSPKLRGVFGKFRDKCRNSFIYNNFSIILLAHNSNGYILFVHCKKLTLVPTIRVYCHHSNFMSTWAGQLEAIALK